MTPSKEDVLWGIRVGLIIGCMYAALVVILYAIGGSARFDRINVPLSNLLVVYLLGGLTAGTVLGVFRPALRDRYSAFVVGVIAAIPVSIGITILVTQKARNWTVAEWSTVAFMSLFVAAVGIAVLWQDPEANGSG